MSDLFTLSATELAARIRAGELSPGEAVEAHIRRIEEVNPALNALTADRFAHARAEARDAERRLREGAAPPLLGVPFTVKEMVSVEGLPHTFGSLLRRGRAASRDATVVSRLRAAGAIPLGVSNVPEWGFWFETDNLLYGRTRNPYDLSRTPGGSSGGEGALVGAGASPFGVGSDIGGSIRMPAAFCGVFGHKPTPGLVPLTGHWPVYLPGPGVPERRTSPYLGVGPLARSARDLMPLLRVMAGPDGVDPNAAAIPLGDPEAVGWRGRRVLLLDAPRITLASRATPGVSAAVRRAAAALAARGAEVEPLPADLFRRGAELWGAALGSMPGPSLAELVGLDRSGELLRQLVRAGIGRPRYSTPTLLFTLVERITHTSARRRRALLGELEALRRRVDALLAGGAVLLMPPHPRVAPRHRRPFLHPFDFAYTAVVNVLRLPATVAPVGIGAEGMPLAVQVVAGRGSDHLGIAAALALEEDLGGWVPPWTVGVTPRSAPTGGGGAGPPPPAARW